MDTEARVLTDFMDSVFYGPGWHGPELLPTLQSLSVEQALQPAGPDGYSAWQLVLHCAYWKHVILQKLGGTAEAFERTPEDFPDLPTDQTSHSWSVDLDLLIEKHEAIKAAVRRMANSDLSKASTDEQFSRESLVLSIAAHDAYHVGHLRNMGIIGLE
jgi:hypothetical protein